jgi:hypothetical protein
MTSSFSCLMFIPKSNRPESETSNPKIVLSRIKNSKSEARNPKQTKKLKAELQNSKRVCLETYFPSFDHLDLFRISGFVLRALVLSWRPLVTRLSPLVTLHLTPETRHPKPGITSRFQVSGSVSLVPRHSTLAPRCSSGLNKPRFGNADVHQFTEHLDGADQRAKPLRG